MTLDRRAFLTRSAAIAGGTVLASGGLTSLTTRLAGAAAGSSGLGQSRKGGYGALSPARAANELGGFPYLALPDGFSYVVLSKIGDEMSDGNPTPAQLDGMAAFAGPSGTVRLIRNHEIRSVSQVQVGGPLDTRYDPTAGGGTTALDYDPRKRQLVRHFVNLNGTVVNCAGGKGFGDRSWITGSGRGSGFYRYLPNNPNNLLAGGRLQMLAVSGTPKVDLRDGVATGATLAATWVDIDAPDADALTSTNLDGLRSGTSGPFAEGYAKGGAKFNRLEGIWYGGGSIFFVSTSGGSAKNPEGPNADGFQEGYGQVWEYRPTASELVLLFQSPSAAVLDSPDNLVVTPRGGLLLCEDDASSDDDTHPLAPGITDVNRLIGLSMRGEAFEFAVNRLNDSEFAGACFSPDGATLFVNILATAPPSQA